MKRFWLSAASLLLLSAISFGQSPFTPIASGYGAQGSFIAIADKFPSPLYESENVYVFRPAGASGRVPVVFFAPGFGNNDPQEYQSLISHIVSRGNALVFAPYQIVSGDASLNKKRYDTIFAAYEEAVRRYGESFDLRRVAFAGHSYGASASLSMAWRGVVDKGWGEKGVALFLMAPWYYAEMSLKQFVNFPPQTKLIVEVFDNDEISDHRIAKEIFDRINLPSSEKDFVILNSEKRLGYDMKASHGTPSGGEINALDYYGIYRLFDALTDYSFNNSIAGKSIALGNGQPEQKFMGTWPDGAPVRPLTAGDCIGVTRSQISFLFPYFPTTMGLTTVSSADFKTETGLAPESLATAWGTNFSLYPLANDNPVLPLELNGTAVRVRDSACVDRLAPLFFVSPTQVNYLVPAGTLPGAGTVTVFNETGAISSGPASIKNVAPALFSADSNGQGAAAASVLRLKPDGNLQYEKAIEYSLGQARFNTLPIDVSDKNDQVFLLLFGTGLRYRSALSNITALVGGIPVEVLYAGSQGDFPGLDQINLRLPGTLSGRGEVDVVLSVDLQKTNTLKVQIR
ncbi:MAG: hypothetical protein IPL01_20610 [Acidobacteria bacterium]|nr:hypothetical protein [Acidobacteriota bacterium]